MGPLEAVNTGFAKIFTVSGRASRSEYWWFFGFTVLVTFLAVFFDGWSIFKEAEAAAMTGVAPNISFNPFDYFTLYCWVIFTIPRLTMTIRRLHDIGKSGFCILFHFVPFIGSLIVFIMTLLPSQRDTNIFGQPPHFPGSGGSRRTTTDASGKPRPHDPMQGYAALFTMNDEPTPEIIAARKAEVRALYEQRVLGKGAPA